MTRAALAFLFLVPALPGCFAGALPPSRTDVGTTVIRGNGQETSGVRFSTGAHLASATLRRELPVDVGIGYVFERVGAPTPDGEGGIARLTGPGAELEPETRDAHGGYLEVSRALGREHSRRAWIGARAELAVVHGDGDRMLTGAHARVSWEMFAPAAVAGGGSTRCGAAAGFAYGMLGLGAFVESGYRHTEGEGGAFVATAGVSLRLPALGIFGIDLCPKC